MNHRRIYSFAVIVFASFILLATAIASTSKPQMLISVDSPYGMRKTIQNIKQSLLNNNFSFLREQTLKDGLGDTEDPHFRILYFCNFAVAHKAIQYDKRIGFMLPCRLTLIEKEGKVTIYYLNPQLVKGLGNHKLNSLCDQISAALNGVIEEATL
jgi:cytochrome c oxidase cbb3-type subunit 3